MITSRSIGNIRINIITVLNYFYIYWTLLTVPVNLAFFHFDAKGRILFVLTFLLFFLNLLDSLYRQVSLKKPALFLLLWCVFSSINSLIKGFYIDEMSISYFIVLYVIRPYVIMCVSAKEYLNNKSVFCTNMLVAFALYAFIGSVFLPIGYVQYQGGGGFQGTLGNNLGLNAIYILLFSILLYCYDKIKINALIIILAITFVLLVMTATRKALGAGLIIVAFAFIAYYKNNLKYLSYLILLLIVLIVGTIFVKNNTYMGQRFANYDETENIYNPNHNLFLSFVGNRAVFYVTGWKVFKEHPITGIGLDNYMHETGQSIPIHSEYMVQLAECGLIGFTLFILFYFSILRSIISKIKISESSRKEGLILLGAFLAIVFIDFTAWSYSQSFYFVAFGTMVGYIHIPFNNQIINNQAVIKSSI